MDFLFDIGRVLLGFDFESSLKRLLPQDDEAALAGLLQAIDARDGYECGTMQSDEFIHMCIERSGVQCSHAAFAAAWKSIFFRNLPMMEDVRGLLDHPHHRLILFSNTNEMHWQAISEQFPEFALFHGRVLSFRVGAMKPSESIYQHAIHRYGLVPGKTCYIDDLPQNIETGESMGFRCHLYSMDAHAAFRQWLMRELV